MIEPLKKINHHKIMFAIIVKYLKANPSIISNMVKTKAGKVAGPSNKLVGYTFFKKNGQGYVTFKTKTEARKKGYQI